MTTQQKVKSVMSVWQEFKLSVKCINMNTLMGWPKFLRDRLPWT